MNLLFVIVLDFCRISAQMNLKQFKTKSFGALGRVHLILSNFAQAVAYFHQGLSLAESSHASGTGIAREEEARLRHRYGNCRLEIPKEEVNP